MGAGFCQWGGLTDQNICNIYGGAMLRLWDLCVCPLGAAGEAVTYATPEGRKARKYIRIIIPG